MLCLSGDNAGNVYSMGGILGKAVCLCLEHSCTPIFIHHFKRTRATADPYAPGELADLTQAGVAEIAGQWLLLTRREAYSPAQAGEHKLWLNIGGRMGHSSLHALDVHEGSRADPGGRRWEVDVLQPEEARQAGRGAQQEAREAAQRAKAEATLENDRGAIVSMMVKLKAPPTKTELRARAPFGHGRFDRAFASLADDGTVTPAEVQKGNNRRYDAWELRSTE